MEDLPEPDTPVKTVNSSLGNSKETFFKLFSRAPLTVILVIIDNCLLYFISFGLSSGFGGVANKSFLYIIRK